MPGFLQADDIATRLDRLRDEVEEKILSAVLLTSMSTHLLVQDMDHKMDRNFKSLMQKMDESIAVGFDLFGPLLQVLLIDSLAYPLSHPTFRRKPSAYLYACQDQVSCI
jgi:hypothetical protein